MQRQPPSLFLVAEAYRQELLADAGVVRRVPAWRLPPPSRSWSDASGQRLTAALARLASVRPGVTLTPAGRDADADRPIAVGSAVA